MAHKGGEPYLPEEGIHDERERASGGIVVSSGKFPSSSLDPGSGRKKLRVKERLIIRGICGGSWEMFLQAH